MSEARGVSEMLEHVAHLLPSQGPIREFIHHNTLHAFQDDSFHVGVRKGAEHFGARVYLRLNEYRSHFAKGRISKEALDFALAEWKSDRGAEAKLEKLLRDFLQNPSSDELDLHSLGTLERGFREISWRDRGVEISAAINPTVARLASAYLDQGLSIWQFPGSSSSFWGALCSLMNSSYLPLPALSHPGLRRVFRMDAASASEYALNCLLKDKSLEEPYLLECHLSHRGWSGMFAQIEASPQTLIGKRPSTLLDLTAVHLALELNIAFHRWGENFEPLVEGSKRESQEFPELIWILRAIWQRAFELSLHQGLVGSLEEGYRQAQLNESSSTSVESQLVFCIDERECSLRRHVEELSPTVETFGAAGFFAIDALFQGVNQGVAAKYCPVNFSPRHVLTEVSAESSEKKNGGENARPFHLTDSSKTLFRGWVTTQVYGVLSGIRLATEVFRPFHRGSLSSPVIEDSSSRLVLDAPAAIEAPRQQMGYTIQEQAERVARLLKAIGLTQNFAPIVAVIGHGSSSVNNPHFAAYDCGACSGKPGAPNARAICQMANSPTIRRLVAQMGIEIPPATLFVAGLHDTCRDTIVFFDIPENRQTEDLTRLKKLLDEALMLNAKERTRRFAVLPHELTPAQALEEVQRRSSAIFEPRPELGHATNAFALVGRRRWSKSVFLDRRAFLHSYDPTQDPSGQILASILGAVIPVCGGINLEYYFSRVDNEVLGAGTKLPHNAAGLIGVTNGVDGDLRTGLPLQMIEIHEPVRLLIVVEQTSEIAEAALGFIPDAKSWVDKQWVLFAAIEPTTGKMKFRQAQGHWVDFPLPTVSTILQKSSAEHTFGRREDLPFSVLTRGIRHGKLKEQRSS